MSISDMENARDEEKGLLEAKPTPLDRLSTNDATIDCKKYASLVWICVQNCAHILLVKYTRVTRGCNHSLLSVARRATVRDDQDIDLLIVLRMVRMQRNM